MVTRSPALPRVAPIVPVRRAEPFDDPAYRFEPKYDGFRGLLYLTSRECYVRSKRGHILTRFRELCAWVRDELAVTDAILDGEIVSLDAEGRHDFRGLMGGRGHLHYAAFDVLWLNGKDWRARPLRTRTQQLQRLIHGTSPVLSSVFGVEGCGRELFRAIERLDLEGLVAKRMADPYDTDTVWYKVKNRAYTQMAGRWELFHPRRSG